MSARVRVAAVAGMFYPSKPEELQMTIQSFLARTQVLEADSPKALIVPHAGYAYSGKVAAAAYAQLHARDIRRVVLLGPSHRVILRGLAAPESLVWETPLGELLIDFQSLEKLSSFDQVGFSDLAHADEHSLEVQLPFLQMVLDEFRIVPLVVGRADAADVADVIESLWGGPETLVVISSDLSHYESYDDAVRLDRRTAQGILELDLHGLDSDCACGLVPVSGMLEVALRKGLRVEQLDLQNSGDTAGPKDRVVGYGAFAFYE